MRTENGRERALRLERELRNTRMLVEIAGTLRDLFGQVKELAEIQHRIATLLAEERSPASVPEQFRNDSGKAADSTRTPQDATGVDFAPAKSPDL